MRTLIALATCLALTSTAFADDDEPKNEETAAALSLGGTVAAGVAIVGGYTNDNDSAMLLGIVLAATGPSFGHWYAHDAFTLGTGVRLGGLAIVGIGAAQAFDETFLEPDSEVSNDAKMTIVAGSVLVLAGAVYDVATAGTAAREYNDEHDLTVAPVPVRDSAGNTSPGFAVAGRF